MSACPWETIRDFRSYWEFERFVVWIEEHVSAGTAEELPVRKPYIGAMFREKWYRHGASQTTWRLVWPDAPFRGVFEPVEPAMRALSRWESAEFVEAVMVWTGFGLAMSPRRDDTAVVARFGAEAAAELLPAIKSLMDEFYRSDARFAAADLVEMGRMASEEFKAAYPQVADEVLRALEWCYTFDYK